MVALLTNTESQLPQIESIEMPQSDLWPVVVANAMMLYVSDEDTKTNSLQIFNHHLQDGAKP